MKQITLIKGIAIIILIVIFYVFNLLHKMIFGYPAGFLGILLLGLAIYLLLTEA